MIPTSSRAWADACAARSPARPQVRPVDSQAQLQRRQLSIDMRGQTHSPTDPDVEGDRLSDSPEAFPDAGIPYEPTAGRAEGKSLIAGQSSQLSAAEGRSRPRLDLRLARLSELPMRKCHPRRPRCWLLRGQACSSSSSSSSSNSSLSVAGDSIATESAAAA
jgi:hypothetical protein